jgi:hypothetical protein
MSEGSHRPLRHRPRERNFRFSDYSKPQSKAPKDDRTLNRKGPQVEVVRPKWDGTGPMTFRPLPMICAEDPTQFDPTRLTTDEYDFSDFWRGLPGVKYVGIDQKFTFLAYDPHRLNDEGYNPRTDNPYHVLYNAVMDAVKKTGEAIVKGRDVMTGKWAPLISDGTNKAFNAPTKIYFLQGLIYSGEELFIKGGSPPKGLRDNDLPQIIEISKSAGEKLARKLNMLNPNYQGDTDIEYQNEMYLYGDIVDLSTGSFLTLFNPKKHYDIVDAFEDFDDSDGEDNKGGFQSWGVAINPDFQISVKRQPVSISSDVSEYADKIRSLIVPWEDILYFPPDEEICLWLAQAFRSMPSLLDFGWADNPEFFTNEVKGVLANRTQVQGADGSDDSGDEETYFGSKKPTPQKGKPQRSAALQVDDSDVDVGGEDVADVTQDSEYDAEDELPNVSNATVIQDKEDVTADYEDDEYDADEDTEEAALDTEEDVSEEEEAAAMAAMERARRRLAPVAPAPAPAKKGPTAKPGKTVTRESKAKSTSKPTPVRRA